MISASWNNAIVLFIWLDRKLTAAFLHTEFKSCICLLEKVQGFLVVVVLKPSSRKTGIQHKGKNNLLKCFSLYGITAEENLEPREWKNASASWPVLSGPGCQDASWRSTSVVLKPNCHDDPAALIQAEGTEAESLNHQTA